MWAIAAPRWRVSWRHYGAITPPPYAPWGSRDRAWRRYGAHTLHDTRYRGAAMACIAAPPHAPKRPRCAFGGWCCAIFSYLHKFHSVLVVLGCVWRHDELVLFKSRRRRTIWRRINCIAPGALQERLGSREEIATLKSVGKGPSPPDLAFFFLHRFLPAQSFISHSHKLFP